MFVRELSGGYEAIFVLVLFGKDIFHHVLVQCVVGRVAMALKLFPQVFFHLANRERKAQVYVHENYQQRLNLLYTFLGAFWG